VLEIGSHLGASTCYLGAPLVRERGSAGRLYCVDTWHNETMPDGERDTYDEFVRNTHPLAAHLTAVRKRSGELRPADVRLPVHLAFIDGDHSYEAVRRDFDTVAQWLAPDGVIAFHDFANDDHEGVTRDVGEALASGQGVQRGLVETLVWISPARWRTPAWRGEVAAAARAQVPSR
jgi:predicted O-methyltransferase YrrM